MKFYTGKDLALEFREWWPVMWARTGIYWKEHDGTLWESNIPYLDSFVETQMYIFIRMQQTYKGIHLHINYTSIYKGQGF